MLSNESSLPSLQNLGLYLSRRAARELRTDVRRVSAQAQFHTDNAHLQGLVAFQGQSPSGAGPASGTGNAGPWRQLTRQATNTLKSLRRASREK